MKKTIPYVGVLFLLFCANIALAVESPNESAAHKSEKEIVQKDSDYNYTLFKFFKIKAEGRKKEEPKDTTKTIKSPYIQE